MIKGFKKSLFITGTDTGIGKTLVSLGIVFDSRAYYWKPIQTGSKTKTDSQFLSQFIPKKRILKEAYVYREPLSPNQASELEQSEIKMSQITSKLKNFSQKELKTNKKPIHSLVIEGAGGLLVPLNKKKLMIDLIKSLKIPVLLVARSGLGTLNHTLLSLDVLRKRKIPIKGLIIVGKAHPYNKRDLEFYGKTKVLWEVPFKKALSSRLLDKKVLKKEFLGIKKKIHFS